MTEEMITLLIMLATCAPIGLLVGIAIRKTRPSWCKSYAKFCMNRKWWLFLFGIVLFLGAAVMSFAEGRPYFGLFFLLFVCLETFVLFKNGILSLFIGTATFQVGGPVAIAQMTGEVARAGISPLLEFAAFLSINLAIINIFPLPALDGGRIIFVLLEWIRRGKRISPKIEGLIHGIGFALLIAAMLAVTYQDIIRIVSGGSFVP